MLRQRVLLSYFDAWLTVVVVQMREVRDKPAINRASAEMFKDNYVPIYNRYKDIINERVRSASTLRVSWICPCIYVQKGRQCLRNRDKERKRPEAREAVSQSVSQLGSFCLCRRRRERERLTDRLTE